MYQFLNIKHEDNFNDLCKRDKTQKNDRERQSLFFVIAGNDTLYKKADLIYDFEENAIRSEVYDEAFLTAGTRGLIGLAFSLFGYGTCDVRKLFSCLDYENSVLAIEALKTRFRILAYPDYFGFEKRASRSGKNKQQQYVSLVLDFLGDKVVEAEEYYYNSVTVKLKNVNFEINGVNWEQATQENLQQSGYNVGFEYGDGNWVEIYQQ